MLPCNLCYFVCADYLVTKCGVLMMSLFVFFTTTMSVSFTLRETQTRMLKFTGRHYFALYTNVSVYLNWFREFFCLHCIYRVIQSIPPCINHFLLWHIILRNKINSPIAKCISNICTSSAKGFNSISNEKILSLSNTCFFTILYTS